MRDAAAHLSIAFGERVTEADVLRLGLDGHLTLSVDFVNHGSGRLGKIVPREQATVRMTKGELVALVSTMNSSLTFWDTGRDSRGVKSRFSVPCDKAMRAVRAIRESYERGLPPDERADPRAYFATLFLYSLSYLRPIYRRKGRLTFAGHCARLP